MANPAPFDLLPDTWKNLYYPPEEKQYTYFQHAERFPFTALDYSKEHQGIIKAQIRGIRVIRVIRGLLAFLCALSVLCG